jgi:hypothetical protein
LLDLTGAVNNHAATGHIRHLLIDPEAAPAVDHVNKLIIQPALLPECFDILCNIFLIPAAINGKIAFRIAEAGFGIVIPSIARIMYHPATLPTLLCMFLTVYYISISHIITI